MDGQAFLLDPAYNGLGHAASLTTPGQTISYAPDAWGRPKQLGSWATAIQYHPNGILASFSYGNGLTFSQSLDARRRPQLQEVKNGAAWIQKLQYAYTNGGVNCPGFSGDDSV